MSDIGKALRTRLLSVSAVTDLVSTRVYPMTKPEGALMPCVVYRRITGTSDEYLGGTTGAAMMRIQFDCYANSYSDAEGLAEQVRLAVHQYRGTVGSVVIHSVNLANRIDRLQMPVHGNDVGYYVHAIDFETVHSETAI